MGTGLELLVVTAKIAHRNLIPTGQVMPSNIPLQLVSVEYVVPGLKNKASLPIQVRQLSIWPEALML